jgi:hypothetical protein
MTAPQPASSPWRALRHPQEQIGELRRRSLKALRSFACGLERLEGGFLGVIAFDEGRDVEYLFYGLGLLALISSNP